MVWDEGKPKLPEIGEYVKGHGKLIAVEDVPPPPPQKDYIFEAISARCEIRHNGKVISELLTLSDINGFETSVAGAIEKMKLYATEEKITPDSDIEVVVVRIAEQSRNKPKKVAGFYDGKYFEFDLLKFGSRKDLPDSVETMAWSSKTEDS